MKDHFLTYPDLASERLGAIVVYATNDALGAKENLNLPPTSSNSSSVSEWIPNINASGTAWAVIRLACQTHIDGFQIETGESDSEAPLQISIDALHFSGHVEDWELADFLDWDVLVAKQHISSGAKTNLESLTQGPYTHIRIHLLSNGGLSRIAAFGRPYFDWSQIKSDDRVDLASITHGGQVLASSDDFHKAQVLIAPTKSNSAEDGWLTQTSEAAPWVIIKLAHPGFVEKLIIDTYNFHNERATSCSLDYCTADNDIEVLEQKTPWNPLLSAKGLKPHRENPFSGKDIKDHEAITHVRLTIYPHGGVSRLRIIGSIKK